MDGLPRRLKSEVITMYGHTEGGTVISLQHVPTGIMVQDGPMKGRKQSDVLKKLAKELIDKINSAQSKKRSKRVRS